MNVCVHSKCSISFGCRTIHEIATSKTKGGCVKTAVFYRPPENKLGFKWQQIISFFGLVGLNHLLGEKLFQRFLWLISTIEINCFLGQSFCSNAVLISKWHKTPSVIKLIFLYFNSLIHILPYGTWLPVTHMSFQSFLLD